MKTSATMIIPQANKTMKASVSPMVGSPDPESAEMNQRIRAAKWAAAALDRANNSRDFHVQVVYGNGHEDQTYLIPSPPLSTSTPGCVASIVPADEGRGRRENTVTMKEECQPRPQIPRKRRSSAVRRALGRVKMFVDVRRCDGVIQSWVEKAEIAPNHSILDARGKRFPGIGEWQRVVSNRASCMQGGLV